MVNPIKSQNASPGIAYGAPRGEVGFFNGILTSPRLETRGFLLKGEFKVKVRGEVCRLGILYLVLLALFGTLSACAPSADETTPSVSEASFPLELLDQADRVVRIEEVPKKIISLAPSNTEILYALGLENKLVGVTEYCDYPESAKDKPQIGGFSTVDIEKVVAIQPDLVLAANIHRDEIVPELERLGFAALTLDPGNIGEVVEAIQLIGRATDEQDKALQVVAEMQERIKSITDKTASLTEMQKPRVFYILWHDPLKTVGRGSRINELIVKAGGINIAGNLEGDYPTMSLEAVIMADPQVIVAGSGHGSGQNLPLDFVMAESRLEEVAARRDNRVYSIDSNLTSRPGPRIVDGLEELAIMIHPELFGTGR